MTFDTWAVVEQSDQPLVNVVTKLGLFNKETIPPLRHVSLERRNNVAVLTCKNPKSLFDRVRQRQAETDKPLLALSLADWDDLRFFNGKIFEFDTLSYRLTSEHEFSATAYGHRILGIEFLNVNIQSNRATDTEIPYPYRDPAPDAPRLLLEPIHLPCLSESQVTDLFSAPEHMPEPTAARPGVFAVPGTFFLPPVRTPEAHPEYFREPLPQLRKVFTTTPEYEVPVNLLLVRLADQMVVRDILSDGGRIRVDAQPGDPTRLTVELHTGSEPWQRYRHRVLLQPDTAPGPSWAKEFGKVLRRDIESLVPGSLNLSDTSEIVDWSLDEQRLGRFRAGPLQGAWQYLQNLSKALKLSSKDQSLLEQYVLDDSGPSGNRAGPDNDLAQRLFIQRLWRCPWDDDPAEPAWSGAMMEQLLHWEFNPDARKFPNAQERVDFWNQQDSDRSKPSAPQDAPSSPKTWFHLRRGTADRALTIDYSGDPTDVDILRWRLLLPIGTVVNARTILLDHSRRSRLDCGFVLAP